MKILIITQLYPEPDDEGDNKPTKTVEYFAKQWSEMGHDVVVCHCPSKFPIIFYMVPQRIKDRVGGQSSNIVPPIASRKQIERQEFGIRIIRYPMLKILPGMGYSDRVMHKQSKVIEEKLRTLNFYPDVVVGHFANPSTALTAILASHYKAKSSIVFHHDCNLKNIQKYKLKFWINKIGAIGARSILEANSVKKLFELKRLPFLCYSGVPNDVVAKAKTLCDKHTDNSSIKILYVGSFIKRKYLDSVIKGFELFGQKSSTLEIVGGGPEEAEIKSLAKKTSVRNRIHFAGRIPRREVMNRMKEAEVFTLISTGETFGMVYIEAMLQGCIVIASRGEGFDGIIKNGVNGFLCEPGNYNELADIYKKISLLTKSERNQIGQNAIDVAMHFSEREVADNYLNDIIESQGTY